MKFNKYYQDWRTHKQDWKKYNLQHLHSYSQIDLILDKDVKIQYLFSHHIFTSKVSENTKYLTKELYKHSPNKDKRVFSIERYKLSLNIKEILEKMKNSNIFFSFKQDYYYFCINEEKNYYIYFDIKKDSEKNKLIILINSWYSKNKSPSWNEPKISFRTLCWLILTNKKVKEPSD